VKPRLLVGCERSGVVREAFRRRGWDAWSCDLAAAEDGSPHHHQCDVFLALRERGPWDLFIFHPECTYLCSSGLHWNKRVPGRAKLTEEATEFAVRGWREGPAKMVMENPIGRLGPVMYERFGVRPQIIQPHQFGHDASKATCLWTRGVPLLQPTQHVAPRIANGKKRWANQTDSGQNRLGPSDERWMERSRTYEGIAQAMAIQYDDYESI
jgi:hypothetical protein